MGHHYSVGCDYRQPKPTSCGEYRMPVAARPELGIEVLRSTELEEFLEELNVAREDDEPLPIESKKPGELDGIRPAGAPMYLGNSTAQRGPPAFVERQGHALLSIRDQMGAEDRPHSRVCARMLKLDCAVDAVRVSASQCPVAVLRRGSGECLRTGDADTKRKMGVDVKVGIHSRSEQ
jgi:hypothetical protein